jgi:nucleosome assembly protein 1-like 1
LNKRSSATRVSYWDSASIDITNLATDTKQTRVVKKTVPTDSFFNFFSPPKAPTDDDDEDAASDIEERLELDYQLGEDIKEKLIPRAIDWFTGEALQFEEMDDMEEGDFEDEDDDEDDDLSENDDDDDESDDDVSGLVRIVDISGD